MRRSISTFRSLKRGSIRFDPIGLYTASRQLGLEVPHDSRAFKQNTTAASTDLSTGNRLLSGSREARRRSVLVQLPRSNCSRRHVLRSCLRAAGKRMLLRISR